MRVSRGVKSCWVSIAGSVGGAVGSTLWGVVPLKLGVVARGWGVLWVSAECFFAFPSFLLQTMCKVKNGTAEAKISRLDRLLCETRLGPRERAFFPKT